VSHEIANDRSRIAWGVVDNVDPDANVRVGALRSDRAQAVDCQRRTLVRDNYRRYINLLHRSVTQVQGSGYLGRMAVY
jgi:hypothetical protein